MSSTRISGTDSYCPADTSPELCELTVGALLARTAAAHPDAPAIVATSRSGDRRRLTYSELETEARRAAHALRTLARPGESVAIVASNWAEWPIVAYGAMLAGLVLVAVNPASRDAELQHVVAHSGASVVIHERVEADRGPTPVVENVAEHCPALRHVVGLDEWAGLLRSHDPRPPLPETDPHRPALLQYTSGTTGRPKGVLLSQYSLVNNARFTMRAAGVPTGAVCASPMPMFHVAGLVTCTLGPLSIAGTQVLIRRFHPELVLDAIEQESATVLFQTPAIVRSLLDFARDTRRPLPRLTALMGGAASVPSGLVREAEKAFGGQMLNLYGQTELASVATIVRPGQSDHDKAHTVGRPLPHLEVKIVDPTTREIAPLGRPGELLVRGYQSFLEYHDDPSSTATTRSPEGWVRTGDLASMAPDGTVTITGRLKEIIIRGGENVSPTEVEAVLRRLDGVLDAAVVGIPDPRFGEVVGAVVVLAEGVGAQAVHRLAEAAAAELAGFKVPTRWYRATALPYTTTGKLQRTRVRETLQLGELDELGAAVDPRRFRTPDAHPAGPSASEAATAGVPEARSGVRGVPEEFQ
ncbi:AMP-binding protein [Pseudonocardia halophobica]|uniref:Fatty-acyl-CoA synthase n=1 Tax=Pseudonocardia halophobica TaxID=29401 RepID=A0A9W6KXA0_9PSEU|nr:class I adenylate-forming enzyme family protein [Pseudonocardia halophobica]GLL09752.1 fatty-acyl-CoA synthase [Pseudonocardia halophobica]